MNQALERTLSNLTGKTRLDDVSVEELEKLTDDYPYFSLSHILLAKKLASINNEASISKARIAALYVSNPWWLHYQLQQQFDEELPASPDINKETPHTPELQSDTLAPETNTSKAAQTLQSIPPVEDEKRVVLTDGDDEVDAYDLLQPETTFAPPTTVVHEEVDTDEPEESRDNFGGNKKKSTEDDSVLHYDDDTELERKELVDEAGIQTETTTGNDHSDTPVEISEDVHPITTVFSLEEIKQSDELAHETLAVPAEESPVFHLTGEEEVVEPLITTEFTKEELEHSAELAFTTLAEEEKKDHDTTVFALPESVTGPGIDNRAVEADEEILQAEETAPIESLPSVETMSSPAVEQEQSVLPEEEITSELQEDTYNEERTLEEDELEDQHSPEAYSNDEMLKNIKSILEAPLSKSEKKEDSLVPIDPYHTVDYFASQGIKLVLEGDPSDKLGKQLKKFTHWLKQMKKLGPEDAHEIVETEGDSEATIIRIADISNTQREVITEAMANVLEKQGKAEKAVQVYIKLSFLHPDKSAYFADKIKKIKGLK